MRHALSGHSQGDEDRSGALGFAEPRDLGSVLRFVLQEVMEHPGRGDVPSFPGPEPVEVLDGHPPKPVEQHGANGAEPFQMGFHALAADLGQRALGVTVLERQEVVRPRKSALGPLDVR